MSEDIDTTPQQNIDPQLGLYAIYIKKTEDHAIELMRKLLNSEMNAEVLQNSLNQANEAYQQLAAQMQQAMVGIQAVTEEREQLKPKAAELDAVKTELENTKRQRDDYHREMQIQINRANDLEHKVAIVEQNARNAIDRANKAEMDLAKLQAEIYKKPDPLDLDQPVKKPKKVAKVK